MTTTALRALTVAALSAAVLALPTPALADDQPVPAAEQTAEQLPEEAIGGARCPDAADLWPCDGTSDIWLPTPEPAPAPVPEPAPAPADQPDPGVEPAHQEQQGQVSAPARAQVPVQTSASAPVDTAAPQPVPTLEQVLEWFRDMLPWLFVPAQRG